MSLIPPTIVPDNCTRPANVCQVTFMEINVSANLYTQIGSFGVNPTPRPSFDKITLWYTRHRCLLIDN